MVIFLRLLRSSANDHQGRGSPPSIKWITDINTSITQEYLILVEKLGFKLDEIKSLAMNGVESSFMSNQEKESMKSRFKKEWKELLGK